MTSKTPLSDAALRRYDEFTAQVRARLENGKTAYGDGSFMRPLAEVVEELIQETADICGWGFVLHSRLTALKADILEATTPHAIPANAPTVGAAAPESGAREAHTATVIPTATERDRRGLSTGHGHGSSVDTPYPIQLTQVSTSGNGCGGSIDGQAPVADP